MRWARVCDVWVVWQGRVGALIKLIISHSQSTISRPESSLLECYKYNYKLQDSIFGATFLIICSSILFKETSHTHKTKAQNHPLRRLEIMYLRPQKQPGSERKEHAPAGPPSIRQAKRKRKRKNEKKKKSQSLEAMNRETRKLENGKTDRSRKYNRGKRGAATAST